MGYGEWLMGCHLPVEVLCISPCSDWRRIKRGVEDAIHQWLLQFFGHIKSSEADEASILTTWTCHQNLRGSVVLVSSLGGLQGPFSGFDGFRDYWRDCPGYHTLQILRATPTTTRIQDGRVRRPDW